MLVVGDAGLKVGAHLAVEMAQTLRDVQLTCVAQGKENTGQGTALGTTLPCSPLYSLLRFCHFRANPSASS